MAYFFGFVFIVILVLLVVKWFKSKRDTGRGVIGSIISMILDVVGAFFSSSAKSINDSANQAVKYGKMDKSEAEDLKRRANSTSKQVNRAVNKYDKMTKK